MVLLPDGDELATLLSGDGKRPRGYSEVFIWEAAAWAAVGSATNIGAIYCEAQARIRGGWPWRVDCGGPGGMQYLVEILIKVAISIGVVAGLSTTNAISNGWYAFCAGIAGPTIVKKVAQYYAENKLKPAAAAQPGAVAPDGGGFAASPNPASPS